MAKKLETLKRFVRGNRGTPSSHLTVKTVPHHGFVVVTELGGGREAVVILNGRVEVEAAIKHLTESLALFDQADG